MGSGALCELATGCFEIWKHVTHTAATLCVETSKSHMQKENR